MEKRTEENKINVISLFSGAGGLDLGLTQTGRYEILLANEILLPPVQTYSSNFNVKILTLDPNVQALPGISYGDIEQLNFNKISDETAELLVGGPPCQDFSIVRGPSFERQGIKVQRGRLYTHFIRALARFHPKIFIMENVPGLKSANNGNAWNTIIEDFNNLPDRWKEAKNEAGIIDEQNNSDYPGYNIVHKDKIMMSDVGVPQARRRVFIIGLRKDLDGNVSSNLEYDLNTKLSGNGSLFSKFPMTPIEIFEGLPLPELDDKYRTIMKEYEGICDEVNTEEAQKWKEKIWDNLEFDIIQDYFFINNITESNEDELSNTFVAHQELLKELGYYKKNVKNISPEDGSNSTPNEGKGVKDRMKMIPPNKNHVFVSGTKWHVTGRGMSLIYRRIHPLKPAYTVVAYGGGGTWTYHYERDRSAITNRERARLQTFPDDFLFKGSRSQVRAQIGEAVPPLVSKRIGEVIAQYL